VLWVIERTFGFVFVLDNEVHYFVLISFMFSFLNWFSRVNVTGWSNPSDDRTSIRHTNFSTSELSEETNVFLFDPCLFIWFKMLFSCFVCSKMLMSYVQIVRL
jgi:hypothetical protein